MEIIPPGYKRTEVGVVPEDWKVVSIESVTTHISDGLHGTPVYSPNSEYFFINGNNLSGGRIIVTADTQSVSRSEFAKHRRPLTNRSVLMSINGTVGNLGLFNGEPVILGKSVAYLNVKSKVSKQFVYYSLQARVVQQQFIDGLTGSTIGNLGLTTIRSSQLPLPPTETQQQAIAAALSDVDALLDALNQLITKKRDLKQAAMQQLLTGQTRLPGLCGDWRVRTLGELASITKGSQLHKSETDDAGLFPHLNGGVSASGYTAEANTPANTIAVSEGGNSCGYVQFMSVPFWCGGHCYAVVPRTADKRFLYHALKARQPAIMGLRVGSGLPNVQKAALARLELNLPSDRDEQTAIAAVLSDLDAELAALERRQAKTRALKQGMMQELLTGRTRLL